MILIRHRAPLLDGQSFAQNPRPFSSGREIGGIRSRKLVASIFAGVLLVVATLVALNASAIKLRSQPSSAAQVSSAPSERLSTEGQPRTPTKRSPTQSTERPSGANQSNRANPYVDPHSERIEEPLSSFAPDRSERRSKKETPREPAEVEPTNPRTLPPGTAPFGKGIASGRSSLLVQNGTDTDAMVRVAEAEGAGQMIRNFYIPAGGRFKAESIPPGNYVLRVAFGVDWNDSQRKFNYRQSFSETEPFEIRETTSVEPTVDGTVTHTRFSKMSITLHKVMNGNFRSHQISEEQFWR